MKKLFIILSGRYSTTKLIGFFYTYYFMAKELPYFKFEPAEYLTKDVSFCSLAAQGLFINLCSYYWQRGCNLSKEQFLRRLNHEMELNELIQEGVIDVIDNDIYINFLDVQFEEVVEKSKTNKTNGSKGGRPIKNRNETEPITETKPNVNPNESESKGIREDKIIEDKKRENIINNAVFVSECKTSTQWIEVTAMQNKVTIEIVSLFIDSFEAHLITMQEQKKTLKEYKEHFTHWFKKQDLSNFRQKIYGKTNQT